MATQSTGIQDTLIAPGQPGLTPAQILAWADTHYRATGCWPTRRAGRVRGAHFFVTWHAVEVALVCGTRGLLGGQSLARLLHEHRGPTRGTSEGPALTVERILALADQHHAATGAWPKVGSGPIEGMPGETWSSINTALEKGRDALPGGTTLFRLLFQQRGPHVRKWLPNLTVEQILAWADAHFEESGQWPGRGSGRLAHDRKTSWDQINRLLRHGGRGLPGGSSLAHVLKEHRGADQSPLARGLARQPEDRYKESVLPAADLRRDPGDLAAMMRGGAAGFPSGGGTMAETAPIYLEDFTVGRIFRTAAAAVTLAGIKTFAAEFDPQPFHLDEQAAAASLFGGLVASGWHTAAIVMKLLVASELRIAGGLIGAGMEEMRWPRPVRPGDTIRAESEVLEVRPSKSQPDRGIVKMRTTTLNQQDQPVMVQVASLVVPRRPA